MGGPQQPQAPDTRRGRAVVAALLFFLAALLVADLLTPPSIRFGPMMVAVPVLAAVLATPLDVLVVLVVTIACVIVSAHANGQFGEANFPVQLTTILLISVAALAGSVVRQNRERALARSRAVAEVVQRLLLRPLPERLGDLRLASLYLTADDEALIGGDLYAARATGETVRILVGDAQGKGLAAVEMANHVLTAFRRGTRGDRPLPELAAQMDEDLRADLAEALTAGPDGAHGRDGGYAQEGFVTAVLLEVPDAGSPLLRMVNLGHPEPFLLHDGTVTPLRSTAPAPPLGLADIAGLTPRLETAPFPPGATLLLYTDGVTEARDPSGAFYPLADRLPALRDLEPEQLLVALSRDLREHVGARLVDDVALVAIQRVPDRRPGRLGTGQRLDEDGRVGGDGAHGAGRGVGSGPPEPDRRTTAG